MFATGLPTTTLVFFAAATSMVVIPSTIQVFAWSMSMLTGRPRFTTPLLFIVGFIIVTARTTRGGWRWRWGEKD